MKLNTIKYLTLSLFFLVLSFWWVFIYSNNYIDTLHNNLYTVIYPLLSLFGGIIGLISAVKWGGYKSYIGKSIIFLSLGLFAQFFGQASYAYYIYILDLEPFPSIGDLGYFGSIIFYFFGALYLGVAMRTGKQLKEIKNIFLMFLVGLISFFVVYGFFLRHYSFDASDLLVSILNYAYPIGQSIYLAITVGIFLLSYNYAKGLMRVPVLLLLAALVTQFFADFMFLFQTNNESWYVGGINDFIYSIAYFLMGVGLLYIERALGNLRSENK
jgi:hypothetical protein